MQQLLWHANFFIAVMNTHQYSYDEKTFIQNSGGHIGLRATCAIARVLMNNWDIRWMEKLDDNGIRIKTGDQLYG